MKNRTCKNCKHPFHFCGSCDLAVGFEDEYCDQTCWLKSTQRKGLYTDARKVVGELSDAGKEALRRLLGVPKKSLTMFQSILDEPEFSAKYDPGFGDNKVCECGHTYAGHFDVHDCASRSGCNDCTCSTFKEAATLVILPSKPKVVINVSARAGGRANPKCGSCAGTGKERKSFDRYTTEYGDCSCLRYPDPKCKTCFGKGTCETFFDSYTAQREYGPCFKCFPDL